MNWISSNYPLTFIRIIHRFFCHTLYYHDRKLTINQYLYQIYLRLAYVFCCVPFPGLGIKWQWSMLAIPIGGEANVWARLGFSHQNMSLNLRPTRNHFRWPTTCNSEEVTMRMPIPTRIASRNCYAIRYHFLELLVLTIKIPFPISSYKTFLIIQRLWYKLAKNRMEWLLFAMAITSMDPAQLSIYKRSDHRLERRQSIGLHSCYHSFPTVFYPYTLYNSFTKSFTNNRPLCSHVRFVLPDTFLSRLCLPFRISNGFSSHHPLFQTLLLLWLVIIIDWVQMM